MEDLSVIATTAVALLACVWVWRRLRVRWNVSRTREQLYKARELDMRTFEEDAVPPELSLFESFATSEEIVHALRAQEMRVVDVCSAAGHAAIRSHDAHNALAETMLCDALERARQLDATGDVDLPMFGVPISLKDCVGVRGYHSTIGCAKYASADSEASRVAEDSLLVMILRDAGAVFHVKTNVPQLMLSFECDNPLFGRTVNPYNAAFTCGGSSGGEAALIASGGSVLGLGTDIGGSVRIPAHFCGITSLKPTYRRLSAKGFRASVPGQMAVPGVCGPMAKRVDSLVHFMRVVCVERMHKEDPLTVPIPWREQLFATPKEKGGLTIGFYTTDGFIDPTPACQRAVRIAVHKLEQQGHTCVLFHPPNVLELISLYYGLLTADNVATMLRHLEGPEQHAEYVSSMAWKMRIPKPLKRVVALLLRHVKGWDREATVFSMMGESSTTDVWRMQGRVMRLRQAFIDAWNEAGLDACVCPAHVHPAIPHGSFSELSWTGAPCMLYNVLDFPAGVVPQTHVRASTDALPPPPNNEPLFDRFNRKHYSVEKAHGLPVGVQVVARPFEEEVVLRVMKLVESSEEE